MGKCFKNFPSITTSVLKLCFPPFSLQQLTGRLWRLISVRLFLLKCHGKEYECLHSVRLSGSMFLNLCKRSSKLLIFEFIFCPMVDDLRIRYAVVYHCQPQTAVCESFILQICPSYLSSCREGPGFSYGLNWALAGKGVIVNDKAFRNLKSSELQQKGATITGSMFSISFSICSYFFIIHLLLYSDFTILFFAVLQSLCQDFQFTLGEMFLEELQKFPKHNLANF